MNISLISKITLSTVTASITSMAISPSAMALTFDLSGTFNDGGTLGGTFDYDESTEVYSNLNINTTGGSNLTGTTYTDDTLIFGDTSKGFIISDDNTGDIDLALDFVSSLSSTSGAIALASTTQEEDFFGGGTRLIASGTVAPVAVPFEPSADLAIFVVMGLMGLNRYRTR